LDEDSILQSYELMTVLQLPVTAVLMHIGPIGENLPHITWFNWKSNSIITHFLLKKIRSQDFRTRYYGCLQPSPIVFIRGLLDMSRNIPLLKVITCFI